MTKHTPTPWRLDEDLIVTNPNKCDKYGFPLTICKIYPPNTDPFSRNLNAQEALANAKYIVKAVNCHDELVEALRTIEKYLPLMESYGAINDFVLVRDALKKEGLKPTC